MSYFNIQQKLNIARSVVTRNAPVYIQYYITARCNLVCQQCNIIYAHADVPEIGLEKIRAVAANLKKIGTSVVLLIGGEPFVREDLPGIIKAFVAEGIHIRIQTNGLASREKLQQCLDAGAKDMSISLDTLNVAKQELINGGYKNSFLRAMKSVEDVNSIFPENGTAFFGTVLMPNNFEDIPNVIKFATAIGWGVSLVPAHVTSPSNPMGFRTYDNSLRFPKSAYKDVRKILDDCRSLRNSGYNLYDSDEYLDDIYRFISNQPVTWRRRNDGVCDSPNLYFAIEPNGHLAPCCDFRLDQPIPVYDPDFPDWYRDRTVHREVEKFTKDCSGCMYGSYPEMTITARYFRPLLHRVMFFSKNRPRLKKMPLEKILELAEQINSGKNTAQL